MMARAALAALVAIIMTTSVDEGKKFVSFPHDDLAHVCEVRISEYVFVLNAAINVDSAGSN